MIRSYKYCSSVIGQSPILVYALFGNELSNVVVYASVAMSTWVQWGFSYNIIVYPSTKKVQTRWISVHTCICAMYTVSKHSQTLLYSLCVYSTQLFMCLLELSLLTGETHQMAFAVCCSPDYQYTMIYNVVILLCDRWSCGRQRIVCTDTASEFCFVKNSKIVETEMFNWLDTMNTECLLAVLWFMYKEITF